MRAYAAHPEGAPRAGIMVFQEIFGVNPHIRDVTERFAREGYLAAAPELFHRTGSGFENDYTDMAAARAHGQATTPEGLTADIRATFGWLEETGGAKLPIASIGFCMGGRVACLSAMTAPVACAISYYGTAIASHPLYKESLLGRLAEVQAPMLFCWGGRDAHIKPENVQQVTDALRAANKIFVSAEFSEADHGFVCDRRANYNANAAKEAWPLTLAYLEDHCVKRMIK